MAGLDISGEAASRENLLPTRERSVSCVDVNRTAKAFKNSLLYKIQVTFLHGSWKPFSTVSSQLKECNSVPGARSGFRDNHSWECDKRLQHIDR